MILTTLLCLGLAGGTPLEVSVVKRMATPEAETISGDAQCDKCPCWRTATLGDPGCAIVTGCQGPCGYQNINDCPECVQWGAFRQSDAAGCVDMDLLPVPRDEWVFWIRARP